MYCNNNGDFRLDSDERFRRGFKVESGRKRRRWRFVHAVGRGRARRGVFAHRLAGLLSLGLGMPAPERRQVTDWSGHIVQPIEAPRAPVVACVMPRHFTYTFPYDGGRVHLRCRLRLDDGGKYLVLEDVTADTSEIADGVPDEVIGLYAEAAAVSRGAVYGWKQGRVAAHW